MQPSGKEPKDYYINSILILNNEGANIIHVNNSNDYAIKSNMCDFYCKDIFNLK